MKVYVVTEEVDYEGGSIIGIYLSEAPADIHAEKCRKNERRQPCEKYWVTEWEVQ